MTLSAKAGSAEDYKRLGRAKTPCRNRANWESPPTPELSLPLRYDSHSPDTLSGCRRCEIRDGYEIPFSVYVRYPDLFSHFPVHQVRGELCKARKPTINSRGKADLQVEAALRRTDSDRILLPGRRSWLRPERKLENVWVTVLIGPGPATGRKYQHAQLSASPKRLIIPSHSSVNMRACSPDESIAMALLSFLPSPCARSSGL